MALKNLRLRGGTYHWRRKITVGGHPIPLSTTLNTGSYYHARGIAAKLEAMLEDLRVAYGQQGIAIQPAQLEQIFKDALRWQLSRIQADQTASLAPSTEHARVNSIHAEAWRFLAEHGPDTRWTPDEHQRLIEAGWNAGDARAVADFLFDNIEGAPVSGGQIDQYLKSFGIAPTQQNVVKMTRVICRAKATACREATGRLSLDGFDYADWTADALADDAPLAFEMPDDGSIDPAGGAAQGENRRQPGSAHSVDLPAAPDSPAKMLLLDACEDCVSAFVAEGAWGEETKKQVRTAMMLFDFACGAGTFVEDVKQADVLKFTNLCRQLPNRWGRTTDEQERGVVASLERSAAMPPSDVGISQTTINKHISWISQVLDFAASARGGDHRTFEAISWAEARKGIGRKARQQQKRDRDRRANWTKQEVARLLSAPVWTGSAGIDDRLTPGRDIYHDGWYWLPLMLALYGGRSAELTGLPLSDVHEDEPIPYFQIDYTEDRAVKNVQSIRKLPVHPELIRLGFIDYIRQIRALDHKFVFPEMKSPKSKSFASTFYKSVFAKLRSWAFPDGTSWLHRVGGAWRDKDVHSFRGTASSMMKGKVEDSVRCDILGHEGETETARTYDEEADLSDKIAALSLLSPFTEHIAAIRPIRLRPADRQKHGSRRGRRTIAK